MELPFLTLLDGRLHPLVMDVIILLEERVRRFFDYGLHAELVLVLLDHCGGDTERFLSGGEVL